MQHLITIYSDRLYTMQETNVFFIFIFIDHLIFILLGNGTEIKIVIFLKKHLSPVIRIRVS